MLESQLPNNGRKYSLMGTTKLTIPENNSFMVKDVAALGLLLSDLNDAGSPDATVTVHSVVPQAGEGEGTPVLAGGIYVTLQAAQLKSLIDFHAVNMLRTRYL